MTELNYGNCENCRFTEKVPDNHYKRRYYELFCVRFPLHPPSDSRDTWSQRPGVNKRDGCWEFQEKK